MTKDLLQIRDLLQSPVVANCRMNRDRRLTGSNGYSREPGFDIADFLHDSAPREPIRWLDVCCGSGKALIEACSLFLANLDLSSIRRPDGRSLSRLFRPHGITYNSRRKLLHSSGPHNLIFPFTYLGSDDSLGPNYTGQPAVVSYYQQC